VATCLQVHGFFPDSIIGIRTTTTTTWKVPTIAKVETGPQSCCSELMKRNSQMTQGGRPFLHLFVRYLLSIPLLSMSLSINAASLLNGVVKAPSIGHEPRSVEPWTRVTLSGKPSQSLLSLQIIQSMPTIETILACRQTRRMINVLLWIIRGRVCHWRRSLASPNPNVQGASSLAHKKWPRERIGILPLQWP
jgi:hypothetical protein